MAVVAPSLESLTSLLHLDKVAYYAQSLEQMVKSAINTYEQLQHAIEMSKMAFRNLRSITKVRGFNDLMDWYNRQLFLERMAEHKFMGMNVVIGGTRYNAKAIAEIPDALRENYRDYWFKEFTPEMRRKVWLDLGMTPSNYAYVQVWKEREKKLLQSILTKRETLNEEYMNDMDANKEIADRLDQDKALPDDKKLQEKELLSMILDISLRNNKKFNDILFDNAEAREYQAAKDLQLKRIPPESRLADDWNVSYFGPITNDTISP